MRSVFLQASVFLSISQSFEGFVYSSRVNFGQRMKPVNCRAWRQSNVVIKKTGPEQAFNQALTLTMDGSFILWDRRFLICKMQITIHTSQGGLEDYLPCVSQEVS